MPRLLIAADDLTGALDTGIQFAKRGIETRVFRGAAADFTQLDPIVEVVVVNTASRHLPKEEAEKIVFSVTKCALGSGFTHFYKKTDSALRGNVGAELMGMQRAVNRPLYFIPAYPRMGRTTKGGMHYVDNVPVAESPFGRDPFSPVETSDVAGVLGKSGASNLDGEIEIFDAGAESDLAEIAAELKAKEASLFAGCAGFAAYLPDVIDFAFRAKEEYAVSDGLIVVTGSVNDATLSQMEFAERSGFPLLTVPREEKADPEFLKTGAYADFIEEALDTFRRKTRVAICSVKNGEEGYISVSEGAEQMRRTIARNIGGIAAALMERERASFLIVGGDVLFAALDRLNPDAILPVAEPVDGVVQVKLFLGEKEIDLFTKSGGFGKENVILRVEEWIRGRKRDETK